MFEKIVKPETGKCYHFYKTVDIFSMFHKLLPILWIFLAWKAYFENGKCSFLGKEFTKMRKNGDSLLFSWFR